ncbi:MAG: C4-type zinc ribbon domain-containing protein [Candidatus Kapaibacterium sp.]
MNQLAELAAIDNELDELHEELGDLPKEVKSHEKTVKMRSALVDETQNLVNELHAFKSNSQIMLQEIKDKEAHYAEQQFQVRNNREFDAITKEIENLRDERNRILEQQRTSGVKEDNLAQILSQQKQDLADAVEVLGEKEKELSELSSGHNDVLKDLMEKRIELAKSINEGALADYERIRTFHSAAAVPLRKNSCTGCFSAVPPQKIVEIRNNTNKTFFCEHCGRILFPEDMKKTSV